MSIDYSELHKIRGFVEREVRTLRNVRSGQISRAWSGLKPSLKKGFLPTSKWICVCVLLVLRRGEILPQAIRKRRRRRVNTASKEEGCQQLINWLGYKNGLPFFFSLSLKIYSHTLVKSYSLFFSLSLLLVFPPCAMCNYIFTPLKLGGRKERKKLVVPKRRWRVYIT